LRCVGRASPRVLRRSGPSARAVRAAAKGAPQRRGEQRKNSAEPAASQRVSAAASSVPRQAGALVSQLLHPLRRRSPHRDPEAVRPESETTEVVGSVAAHPPGGPPPAREAGACFLRVIPQPPDSE